MKTFSDVLAFFGMQDIVPVATYNPANPAAQWFANTLANSHYSAGSTGVKAWFHLLASMWNMVYELRGTTKAPESINGDDWIREYQRLNDKSSTSGVTNYLTIYGTPYDGKRRIYNVESMCIS